MRNVKLHDCEFYVHFNTTFPNFNTYTLVFFSQNYPLGRKKKGVYEGPKGFFSKKSPKFARFVRKYFLNSSYLDLSSS
jgi:hypothetical protein